MIENYTVENHIPQQLEVLLNATDGPVFEHAYTNIRYIVKDKKFQDDLDGYEQDFEQQTQTIEKNTLESVKKAVQGKNLEDMLNTIDECLNAAQADVNRITNEFYDTVKKYILLWWQKKTNA